MEFILEFFTNIIYVWSFICIGQWFFDFKRRNSKYEKLVLVFLTLLTTVAWIYVDAWWKTILHVTCVGITLCFFYREKVKTLLVFYIGILGVLTMLGIMIDVAVSEILLYWQIVVSDNQLDMISQLIVLLFVWLIGNYFKEKYPNGLRTVGVKYLLLFAIILLIDATIVVVFGHFVMDMLEAGRKWLFVLLHIGIVIGILIQIVLLINALITRNIYKENEILAKKYLESQNEHYIYLEKREEETKKFRHDIRNHLLVFEDLLQKCDYQGLEAYTKNLHDRVNVFNSHITVNNSTADAILNKYYDEAKDKGVELQVNGHFPLVCEISAYDICTVLSNLLSNAILAEVQAEGKKVSLDIRYTEDEILMALENDYIHELRMENGTFKTTKVDGLGHGYGLANVITTIENNGGTISIQTENKRFKVMLAMKNRRGENS